MCKKRVRGWTKEQDDFLDKYYCDLTVTLDEICEAIGKSESTVVKRASEKGMTRRIKTYADNKKYCPNCKEYLEYDAFPKNKSKKSGIATYCRVCENIMARAKRMKNKEALEEKNIETKLCKECNKEKNISEFSCKSLVCNSCRVKKSNKKMAEKLKI